MRWQRGRRSANVEDRRGMRGARGLGGLSIGTVVVALAVGWLFGVSPLHMLGILLQAGGELPMGEAPHGGPPPRGDERAEFVSVILGETEETWSAIFAERGRRYETPRLVLFDGYVQSACGGASAATGPFYCPADHQAYLDLGFFEEMRARLGGGGDFAEAYVIAHEIGHHVQTLSGVTGEVDAIRRRGGEIRGESGPLVRQELQADCFAGVWAHDAERRHGWLDPGDVEEALATATAIGDDRLQRQSSGTVVPDSFTHGTSEQRVRWFRRGFESGDPDACDTFAVAAGGL